jgi:hypothetical protein
MSPLRALRMHESCGKVKLTLMTDRIIWRVRRREVARVSSHDGRENTAECCNAPFGEAGSETLGCKGRQSRVEVADVRVRERGAVSICRPSPAFPPLRGREGKCERRHEHRVPGFCNIGPMEPTMVTSSPSRIHVTPSAMTNRR